jgi:hypothetical protein
MSNLQTVSIDAIRTLAHGSISGSYAAVGVPFANPVRLICFTNNTDGDMLFSTDGTTDMLFVAAGGFKLFDLNTNRTNQQQYWVLPAGTQIYAKQSTAPTKNSIYVECLWGQS